MKFIYSCDIHGDIDKYEKLFKLTMETGIKNIVVGGDILPKKAAKREPIQREFIRGYFKEYYDKLQKNDIKFISILGNDDLEIVEDEYYEMISAFPNIIDINERKVDVDGVSFIGMAKVLDTPFARKNRIVVEDGQEMPKQRHDEIYINKCRDIISVEEWKKMRETEVERMEDVLDSLPEATEGLKAIFVFHDPPYKIGLDSCRDGDFPGSKAMLKYIENKQPYMTLHGHIHESPECSGKWYTKIGKTICINPGQTEFGEELLHYAIIDTENDYYERFFK